MQVEQDRETAEAASRASRVEISESREIEHELHQQLKEAQLEIATLASRAKQLDQEVTRLESARNTATDRTGSLQGEVEMLKGQLGSERQAAETALGEADGEIARLAKALNFALADKQALQVRAYIQGVMCVKRGSPRHVCYTRRIASRSCSPPSERQSRIIWTSCMHCVIVDKKRRHSRPSVC
jgi:predicted RNase H-like nuclease (RuvC/YqgF family)